MSEELLDLFGNEDTSWFVFFSLRYCHVLIFTFLLLLIYVKIVLWIHSGVVGEEN